VGHGKGTPQWTRIVKARDDDAHRVFNLIMHEGCLPIYIILDLDDEIAVIPRVWFTRNVALDFFALLRTR
jgi:hypothetical protein